MAETPTPPGALPAIRSGMRLTFSLEYLIALLGGVVFCTITYVKLDRLESDMSVVKKMLGLSDIQIAPVDATKINGDHRGANP